MVIISKTRKLEVGDYLCEKDYRNGFWIHYKGHNIPKDILQKELNGDWLGLLTYSEKEETMEEVVEILEIKEDYYYCTRYYEGCDARDEGYSHWIEFKDKPKKTYGKSTNVKIRIKFIEKEFISFGQKNKGKLLKDCLTEEEINDILDVSKYTYYRPEDLNKIVGLDIEAI